MRRSEFTLDVLGPQAFEGRSMGDRWNGWACPYFDFAQAQAVAHAWREQGRAARFDAAQNAFVFEQEVGEPDEVFAAVSVQGAKYYPLGASSWTWEEAPGEQSRVEAVATANGKGL